MAIKKNDILYFLLILLILSQFCYPFRDIFPKALTLFCGIIFIFSIFLYEHRNKTFLLLVGFNIFIFLRIIFSGNYSFNYFAPINIGIRFFLLLEGYSIYLFLKRYQNINRKRIKYLMSIIKISLIIDILISFYYINFLSPTLIRNASRYKLLGLGDFELMYALSFCLVAFWAVKEKKKMFFMITFIFFGLIILKSNIVTSCVIYILAILLCIVFNFEKKQKFILLNIGILFLLFFQIIKKILVEILKELSQSDFFYFAMKKKIIAVSNLLQGDFSNIDTLNLRYKLILRSLNTFKENLLLGVNYKEVRAGVIGGHAGWFDLLAQFGIFGCFIIKILLYKIYKEQLDGVRSIKRKNAIKIGWLLFIILGFLNPHLMGAVIYSMFILIPFIF